MKEDHIMIKNTKITSHIKSSVLSDLDSKGYSISKIAQTYGISRGVIYAWIKELQVDKAQQVSDTNPPLRSDFIEVALVDGKDNKNFQSSDLQKASLTFNNFSFVIEGKVTGSSLIAIIKILEEQSW